MKIRKKCKRRIKWEFRIQRNWWMWLKSRNNSSKRRKIINSRINRKILQNHLRNKINKINLLKIFKELN